MFTMLRRFIVPFAIISAFFFLLLIVLQWGADFSGQSGFAGNPNVAGVVNGEEIAISDYNFLYNQIYQSEIQATDANLSDAVVRRIEETAWQQLVQDKLLLQEAQKNDIQVSDEDVYTYLRISPPLFLQQAPAFQTDGVFDYQKYLGAMADPTAAPLWSQIEPAIRSDIRKLKLQQLITQMTHVTETEVKQSFIDSLESISIDMVLVPLSKYSSKAPTSTEDQLAEFFEEHKEDYQLDERSVLNYIELPIKATDSDWEIARIEAHRIYDSLINGADFASTARLYSDDKGSAVEGGDLGWFAAGRMVAAFDSAAFSMKEGDISAPIRTEFGYHVLKQNGYRTDNELPPGKTEKEDVPKVRVSHILVKAAPSSDTRDAMNRRLDNFVTEAGKVGFAEAAEAMDLTFSSTVPFQASQQGAFIREIRGFISGVDFAKQAKVNDISIVYEFNSSYYVLQLAKQIPAGVASFEEVRPRVRLDFVSNAIKQMCSDTLEAVYAEIEAGASLSEAAGNHGLLIDILANTTRGTLAPNVSRDPRAIGAAFALKQSGDISKPIHFPGGSVLFSLVSRSEPDLTSFNQKRDSVLQAVTTIKQSELYQQWYQKVFEGAQIENYLTALQQGT